MTMKGQLPGENMSDTAKRNNPLVLPLAVDTLDAAQQATNIHESHYAEADDNQQLGRTGLSTMLVQITATLRNRANTADIDVLNFSLHHLFSRIDYLYRTVLPELLSVSPAPITEESRLDDLLRHQHIWTKLRTIKQTLNRLEPLCHLLGNATECTLDVLDRTSGATSPQQASQAAVSHRGNEQDWLQTLNHERLEQAMTTVMESLSTWQEQYNDLTLIVDHFVHLVPTIPELIQLDETFTILLDCTGAIFGDILPGFQAISEGDDDAVATLLFDLMHQSDQLLAQCDAALEPLHALIAQFALQSNK